MASLPKAFRTAVVAAFLVVLAGCSGDGSAETPPAEAIEPGGTGTVALDDRPFTLTVPAGYDDGTPVPLVLSLHGYTVDGPSTASYFGLPDLVDERGYLLAYPDGLADSRGEQYWNATDACCDFDRSGVDDSAYLASVIETVAEQYAVDPQRVFVVGHSNGGFMALRMACDHADLVAAAVSVAGAMPADTSECRPERPVSIVQVHSDADETISYRGGSTGMGSRYSGAEATVERWRTVDRCDATPAQATADLEATLEGEETTTSTWSCADGTEVGLWTIAGGRHSPTWSDEFPSALVDWMLAHGREG